MTSPRRPAGDADTGFATIWTLIAMMVVIVASGVVVTLGAVVLDQHRAATAADAAALGAALAAIEGPDAACRQATELASRNHAVLTGCSVVGSFATVSVAVSLPGPLAQFGRATARSRAGPATAAAQPGDAGSGS